MRLIGRRTASRRLTVAEVQALADTPVELAPTPGPGVALLAVSMVLRKTAGASSDLGTIVVGSNDPVQQAALAHDLGALGDAAEVVYVPANGYQYIGSEAGYGSAQFGAIENRPLVLALSGGDFSATEFELDVDVEILEVPVE